MEELKKQILERTGLDPAMVDKVVEVVTGFLKDHPEELSGLVDDDEGVMGKLKGIFGRG